MKRQTGQIAGPRSSAVLYGRSVFGLAFPIISSVTSRSQVVSSIVWQISVFAIIFRIISSVTSKSHVVSSIVWQICFRHNFSHNFPQSPARLMSPALIRNSIWQICFRHNFSHNFPQSPAGPRSPALLYGKSVFVITFRIISRSHQQVPGHQHYYMANLFSSQVFG